MESVLNRLEDLISGATLPEDEYESLLMYAYTSQIQGSNLHEIYISLEKDIDINNPKILNCIIVGYAVGEITSQDVDFKTEGSH